jgi:2-amino-4-hydroxy-6-hydroxymethyldihydropteridine diphosphokinase
LSRGPVFIGIGSNVGDRDGWLQAGIDRLVADVRFTLLRRASVYETAAIGADSGGPFLNTAISGLWDDTPGALLAACRGVEDRAGRRRPHRWAPRTLDLDILFWRGVVLWSDELQIPHARLTERAFALLPLLQLAPGLTEPATGRAYAGYLSSELLDQGVVRPGAATVEAPRV